MARGTFVHEKSFKDVPNISIFKKAISDMSPTTVDDSANANAWAKHVNQIDWEKPNTNPSINNGRNGVD